MDFDEVISKLKEIGNEIAFEGAAEASEIERVEAALGVKFNAEYRSFLEKYGGGGVITHPFINGIKKSNPFSTNIWNVYGATMYAREEFNLDEKYIVIELDDDEALWVMDGHQPDSAAVFFIDRNFIHRPQKNSNSFNEFLQDAFEGYLHIAMEDNA